MVGGLKYIENIQNLVRSYYFEENYLKIFTQRREISLAKIEESKNFSNFVLVDWQSLSHNWGRE